MEVNDFMREKCEGIAVALIVVSSIALLAG